MTGKRKRPAPEEFPAGPEYEEYQHADNTGAGLPPVPQFPDWRCEAIYPKGNALTPRQWAWEFLRRNPDYWDLWDLHGRGPAAVSGGGYFGLARWVDPNKTATEIGDPPFVPWRAQVHLGGPPRKLEIRRGKAAIIVDTALPLAPQLEDAKRQLRELAEGSPRLRTDVYQRYLRILDATHAGKSDIVRLSDIARLLTKPRVYGEDPDAARRAVGAQLKAARRLSEGGGYVALAAMPAKVKPGKRG